MPQVRIQSSSGPVLINYTIATPTSERAQSIDPTLPTVLFLHPVYVAQVIFHYQFASPNVRRFNLVALDERCHGETVGAVPTTFRREDAADDIFKFMEALRLPACHLFGVSLGACVALQIAITYPQKVLSLFMLSPLPLIEPEIVASGRQEIFDCWVEAYKDPKNLDQGALLDTIFGALQLGFNGSQASITTAVLQLTLSQAFRNWTPDHFDEFHTVSVKFFVDRVAHSVPILRSVKCPVHIVHCGGDIAYPLHFSEELRDLMVDAGLDVIISQVDDAPHFGCITHPEEINNLFHEWITDKIDGKVPGPKASVKSPFEADLMKFGYMENEDSEDEDELMFL